MRHNEFISFSTTTTTTNTKKSHRLLSVSSQWLLYFLSQQVSQIKDWWSLIKNVSRTFLFTHWIGFNSFHNWGWFQRWYMIMYCICITYYISGFACSQHSHNTQSKWVDLFLCGWVAQINVRSWMIILIGSIFIIKWQFIYCCAGPCWSTP